MGLLEDELLARLTLTLPVVADNLQRPLFRVQIDRLGSYPATIGKRLQEAFALALHWKAILLLDGGSQRVGCSLQGR